MIRCDKYGLILGLTDRRWKIWSHLSEQFVYDTPINSTFLSKYEGFGGYRTKIEKSGSNWAVYIFNYTTSQWENKWQVTGSPTDHPDGWCFWEEYDLDNNWPTLPKVEASNIMVKRGDLGSWFLANSTYAGIYRSSGFPPSGFPYPYGWTSQYYNWYVGPY